MESCLHRTTLSTAWYSLAPRRPSPIPLTPRISQLATRRKHSERISRRCQQVVCRGSRGKRQTQRKPDKVTTFRFMDTEVKVPTDNLWQLALPAAALFAFSAVLGPLVIGIAASAIAVGAAFSTGFLFVLPIIIVMGFIPLIFGAMTFGTFLTIGVASAVAKVATLVIAASGLAVGWGVVSFLNASKGKAEIGGRYREEEEEEEETEEERLKRELKMQKKEYNKELREFDRLLNKKEERSGSNRVDRWRP